MRLGEMFPQIGSLIMPNQGKQRGFANDMQVIVQKNISKIFAGSLQLLEIALLPFRVVESCLGNGQGRPRHSPGTQTFIKANLQRL